MADLLLDTTYLLPAFGVSLRLEGFELRFSAILQTHNVWYNPASLVEAKWIILKLGRQRIADRENLLERYRLGLKVLLGDGRLKQTELTNEAIEKAADRLLVDNKVKDYFDRTIFGTACANNSLLLTEDEELQALKADADAPRPKDVLAWSDLEA